VRQDQLLITSGVWDAGLTCIPIEDTAVSCRYATGFQAEIYAILACVHEIQTQNRSEKYASICSDIQAALKALQASQTTSPLVLQCQRVSNDISTWYAVVHFWIPGHAGVRGSEITDGLARGSFVLGFLGPELALGVSRREIKK
jgi:ribonuclease HI